MPDYAELARHLAPDVLLELTDDNGDNAPDDGIVAAASAAAEAHVREAVAGVLSPGDALPPVLADVVCTLTIERLCERRREATPGPWKDRANRARVLLAEIAGGRNPATGPAVRCTRTPEDRTATPETLGLL